MPTWLFAYVPRPTPRPVTFVPLWRLDAATFGFHPAAIVEASRTDSHLAPATVVPSMFSRRNWTGSMLIACASSSTICSLAKYCCGALGARRKLHLSAPPYSGCVFEITRRGYWKLVWYAVFAYGPVSDGAIPPAPGVAGQVTWPSARRASSML